MQSRLTEKEKRNAEAYGLIYFYKLRARRASIVYWFLVVVSGIVGTFLWSWLAMPLAILAAVVWGGFVSYRTTKIIEKRTGMNAAEQWELLQDPMEILPGNGEDQT